MANERAIGQLTVKMNVDNVEVNKGINETTRQIGKQRTEWGELSKAQEANGKSADALMSKITKLNNEMKLRHEAIEKTKKELDNLGERTDKNGKQWDIYTNKLKKLEYQQRTSDTQLEKTITKWREFGNGIKAAQDKVESASKENEALVKTLNSLGKADDALKAKQEGLKNSSSLLTNQVEKQTIALAQLREAGKGDTDTYRKMNAEMLQTAERARKAKGDYEKFGRQITVVANRPMNDFIIKMKEINELGRVTKLDKFGNELDSNAKRLTKFSAHLKKTGSAMSSWGQSNMLGTFAIGGALIKGAKDAAALQNTWVKSTNLLVTGGDEVAATHKHIAEATAMAEKMSVKYGKSQHDISEGYMELIKRGYSAEQSTGSMKTMLQASVATGDKFEDTLAVSSQTLEGFGLKNEVAAIKIKKANGQIDKAATSHAQYKAMTKYSSDVTNELAYAADMTATDFQSMGKAMEYVGSTAHTAGLSLSETSSAIGILSNAGLESDKAGTGLRKVINSFISPTKGGASVMKALNIQIKDAKGKMLDLSTIFGQFNDKMKTMSETKKASLMHALFGTTGQQAGIILAENGKQIDALNDKVKKASQDNYVGNLAAKNQKTVTQQLARAKEAWNKFSMSFGVTLLPYVTKILETFTKWMDKFSDLDEGTKKTIALGLAFAGLAPIFAILSGGIVSTVGTIAKLSGGIAEVIGVAGRLKNVLFDISEMKAGTGLLSALGGAGESDGLVKGAEEVASNGSLLGKGKAFNKTGASKVLGYGGAGVGVATDVYKATQATDQTDKIKSVSSAALGGLGGVLGTVFGGPVGALVGQQIGSFAGDKLASWGVKHKQTIEAITGHKGKVDPSTMPAYNGSAFLYISQRKKGNTKGLEKRATRTNAPNLKFTEKLVNMSDLINFNDKTIQSQLKKGLNPKELIKNNRDTYSSMKKTVEGYYKSSKKNSKENLDVLVKNGILTQKQEDKKLAKTNSDRLTYKKSYEETLKMMKKSDDSYYTKRAKLEKKAKSGNTSAGEAKKLYADIEKLDKRHNKKMGKLQEEAGETLQNMTRDRTKKETILIGKLQDSTGKKSDKWLAKQIAISAKLRDKTIDDAEKTKNKSIDAANDKYDETTKAADEAYYVNKTISKKQYQDIVGKAKQQKTDAVKAANDQKDKVIKAAKDQHKTVVSEAKKQSKDHLNSVDKETGKTKGAFGTMISDISTKFKEWNLGSIFKTLAETAIRAFREPISTGIKALNAVLGSFGGKKNAIPDFFKSMKFATGTGTLSNGGFRKAITETTHAVLNDGYDSPETNNQEMVILPNGKTVLPQGRNAEMIVPAGTEVLNARETAMVMGWGKQRFATGTGFFDGMWKKIKKSFKSASKMVSFVTDAVKDPAKKLSEFFNPTLAKNDTSLLDKNLASGAIKATTDQSKTWFSALTGMMNTRMSGGVGAGSEILKKAIELGSGKKYVWAENGPDAYDCSGLVMETLKQFGVNVPHQSQGILNDSSLKKISKADAQPGDIAVYGNASKGHVGFVAGKDKLYSALSQSSHPNIGYSSLSGFPEKLEGILRVKGLKSSKKDDKKSDNKLEKLIKSQVGGGLFKFIDKNLAPLVGDADGDSLGAPKGSGVTRWKPQVEIALKKLNLDSGLVNKVLRQINTESGGNPKAMGGTDGLKDGRATGLMQVKPGTFSAYKLSGHGNIMNGYDNMLAGLNYAKHRYGSGLSFLGNGHGYENGGFINKHQIAEIGEGDKAEMVLPLTNKSRAVQLMHQAIDFMNPAGSKTATVQQQAPSQEIDLSSLEQKLDLLIQAVYATSISQKDIFNANKTVSQQQHRLSSLGKGI